MDPLRLQQALVNLLKNAFQATTSGAVTVRLEAPNEHITISIEDTGPGMSEEIRSRLFQPFYTTKPRSEGLGLGLVYAKQVILAHEGSVEVQTAPGKGSTFTNSPSPSRRSEPGVTGWLTEASFELAMGKPNRTNRRFDSRDAALRGTAIVKSPDRIYVSREEPGSCAPRGFWWPRSPY